MAGDGTEPPSTAARLSRSDTPDAEKIGTLVKKLGEATIKAADRAEDKKVAERVRALGEALTAQAA